MNILELATRRKTSRKFKQDPVNKSDIEYILNTARQAPSGSNQQPWRFIIVEKLETKQQIREAAETGEKEFYENLSAERKKWYQSKGLSPSKPNLTENSLLIVILGDTRAPNYKPSLWVAISYAMLAIEELGLATVPYTPSNPVLVSEAVGAPDEFIVEAVLPIGVSDDAKEKESRKGLSELTFRERWGKVF